MRLFALPLLSIVAENIPMNQAWLDIALLSVSSSLLPLTTTALDGFYNKMNHVLVHLVVIDIAIAQYMHE